MVNEKTDDVADILCQALPTRPSLSKKTGSQGLTLVTVSLARALFVGIGNYVGWLKSFIDIFGGGGGGGEKGGGGGREVGTGDERCDRRRRRGRG